MVFEIEVLITTSGVKGETGRIAGIDRRFAPTAQLAITDAVNAVHDELTNLYLPATTPGSRSEIPRVVRLSLIIERKEVTTYGQKKGS